MARALEGIGRTTYRRCLADQTAPIGAITVFQAAEKLRAEVSAPRWQAEEELTKPIIERLQTTYPTEWKPLDQVEVAHLTALLLPAPHLLITDISTLEEE